MGSVEDGDFTKSLTAHDAQIAAGIPHGYPGHPVAITVGNAGGKAAGGGVVAGLPYAADGIGPGSQKADQTWDFAGRILEVGIECGNDIAAGMAEPGGQAGALAEVGVVKEPAYLGARLFQFADDGSGAIAAVVVDQQNFTQVRVALHGGTDGIHQSGQAVLLVISRGDDGNFNRRFAHGWASVFCL